MSTISGEAAGDREPITTQQMSTAQKARMSARRVSGGKAEAAAGRDQLIVRSAFDHAAIGHDVDHVGDSGDRVGVRLPSPALPGLPGSSTDLSLRAVPNHPGRPGECLLIASPPVWPITNSPVLCYK